VKNLSGEYLAREAAASRQPLELFEFRRENSYWRYSGHEEEIVYDGKTWYPLTIVRHTITAQAGVDSDETRIVVPADLAAISALRVSLPSPRVWVRVLILFRDQTPPEAVVIFAGRVTKIKWGALTAELAIGGVNSLFEVSIPPLRYQAGCNWTLGDSNCGVNLEARKLTITAAVSDDGLQYTSNDLDVGDGYWALGALAAAGYETLIRYHAGAAVRVSRPIPGVEGMAEITVWPGCDYSLVTCYTRYNNVYNFGGCPHMPLDNPCLWINR
jgi:uncharacterized phage protein (TIGR02218 family)